MAPSASKHDPMTSGLSPVNARPGEKNGIRQLESSTLLAHLGQKPLHDYLKKTMCHLKKQIKKNPEIISRIAMAVKDFLAHVPPSLVLIEDDILCSVLGLQNDVACRLSNIDPKMRTHQTDLYFILQLLEDACQFCDGDENLKNRQVVAPKLQQMGFTENLSVVVASCIAKQPFAEHQSLLAWAQHYIEDLFNYDFLLNEFVSKYPYKENNVNEWFSVPIERENEKNGVVKSYVHVINTTKESPKMQERVDEFRREKMPNKNLYFHGTDHKGAKSILEDGINLEVGKLDSDFSRGHAFYLTESSDFAIKWACKGRACAVVMFSIEESVLNKFSCLDLSSSCRRKFSDDWKAVVNHFRKGHVLSRDLSRDCKKYDYIAGPISGDGIEGKPQEIVPQICIKKEPMADDIGKNICGVIFAV